MTIAALVPAHNESLTIVTTIKSLQEQTIVPERIIVVCDNCTDDTKQLALGAGAEVFVTVGNVHKKAGALNQALVTVVDDYDHVLCMDADSILSPIFVQVALKRFTCIVGAVGGLFYAIQENNLLRIIQGNEYHRHAREILRRRNGRANVLTGTGSLFRTDVLRQLCAARANGTLPGKGYFQETALTEDNEITLAIKHLGYQTVSPEKAGLQTDVPATVKELWHQRIRWRRGSLEDFKKYGITKITAPYLGKLIYTGLASITSWLYLGALMLLFSRGVALKLTPFWTSVFGVYLFERWWSIKGRSWKAQLVAMCFPLEMLYDVFQQGVYFTSVVNFIRSDEQRWVSNREDKQKCITRNSPRPRQSLPPELCRSQE